MVAGLIERTSSLLPQLAHPRDFDYALAAQGARIMLWGFFKKALVADTLAGYVDRVYSAADAYSGSSQVFAALAFAAQIYCPSGLALYKHCPSGLALYKQLPIGPGPL